MTRSILQKDVDACQQRTRKTLGVSFTIHILLLAWLLVLPSLSPDEPALVEITWLEPQEAMAAEPSAAEPVEQAEVVPVPKEQSPEKFQREMTRAPVEPTPQTLDAIDDKLSEKLARLRSSNPTEQTPKLAVSAPKSAWQMTPATTPQTQTTGQAQQLVRDTNAKGTVPSELKRAPAASTRSTKLAVAPTRTPKSSPTMATIDENTAQRTLDGASLVGPVADRPLVSHKMPVYPDWARRDAIEASVTLYFLVLPDGRVKESILVKQTSGYSEFDRNAETALLAWRFAPLSSGHGEQWGTITFHFRLTD